MVKLVYTTYISVDLAHHEIFCAKVGNGGIMISTATKLYYLANMYFKEPKILMTVPR